MTVPAAGRCPGAASPDRTSRRSRSTRLFISPPAGGTCPRLQVHRFPGTAPELCGPARGRDGRVEPPGSRPFVQLDNRSRQREVRGRIAGFNLDRASSRRDLLPQRVLAAPAPPAARTSNRNRTKVEPPCLVPVLLLPASEREGMAALDAAAILVHVEVLRRVPRAEHLA